MAGFFNRLKEGLSKTKQGLVGQIERVFLGAAKVDDALYEELEDALLGADVGVEAARDLVENLRLIVKEKRLSDPAALKEELTALIAARLGRTAPLREAEGLSVYLIVGVNGVGKTTTVGKLAVLLKNEGRKVVLAAADTFRAAAADQLEIWSKRSGSDIIRQAEGADPAAVVFDAIRAARARKADVLLVDTAGRLHNKVNLMNELSKIRRVIEREAPGGPHEVLLVLDATTGQNALQQIKVFREATAVTGIVLTKIDGTAKGGVVIGIQSEAAAPVKFIGVGESIEDLQPFDPEEFARALFA
ncbi:MAG: signal recognition particle-docking protein FtsY [Gracilibacteraceae bacterium]|jgi:fused signal recognition particle receptor|nr:signal recognition particle-docking protein FtsY [Gracilibacteraceae bacterium]